MDTVERKDIPPPNPRSSITEADRSRVYDIVRRELAELMSGNQSYHPDGMRKDAQNQTEDLKAFIDSIRNLRGQLDDPSDVLGLIVGDLDAYSNAFKERIEKNTPNDAIELPRERTPETSDLNGIFVDPEPGPYSPRIPWSQLASPRERRASLSGRPYLDHPPPGPLQDADGSAPLTRARFEGSPAGLVSGKPMKTFGAPLPISFEF